MLYVLFVLLLLLAVRVHFLIYSFCIFFLFIVLCVFLYFIITAALCVLINGMEWNGMEFQYDGRLDEFNGMSSQSRVSHCRVLPLGEFIFTIPEPHATLQDAVT